MITVAQLAELAKEAQLNDPIDWGELPLEEQATFELMASSVVEQFNELPNDQQLWIAMGTIVKLLVENFVLKLNKNKQLTNNTLSVNIITKASMVKLVDTLDLGSSAARRGGSSPFTRTKQR